MLTEFVLFLLILDITLYIVFASWLRKVLDNEKCQCSKDWRARYILIFPIVAIVFTVINLVLSGFINAETLTQNMIYGIYGLFIFAAVAIFVGWILFMVFSTQYTAKLKSRHCDCATKNENGDDVLEGFTTYKIVMFGMAFLGMIVYAVKLFVVKKAIDG
jgi:hypothetical protein